MQITLKDALTFGYGMARRVAGGDAFADEVKEGAGCSPAEFESGPGDDKPRPTALALMSSGEDIALGFVLCPSVGAIFDPAGAITGGDPASEKIYTDVTYVSPHAVYCAARVGGCGHAFVARFNLHLLVEGVFPDGTSTVTPIIIDPEIRMPPPGYRAP